MGLNKEGPTLVYNGKTDYHSYKQRSNSLFFEVLLQVLLTKYTKIT